VRNWQATERREAVLVLTNSREARVVASGDVDFVVCSEFRSAVESAFASGAPRVVIDLESATFFDTTGLAVLVVAYRMAALRAVELVVLPGCAYQAIRVAGMAEMFGLRGTPAQR
jgi:anti-anti-sigma factor